MGGAIAQFLWRGRNVLRPALPEPKTALDMASFALVPFANRIAHGSFRWDGETVRLARNFGDHPHVLHGHGWLRPWQVEYCVTGAACLTYDYEPGDWPWPYRAEQTIRLGPDYAEILLRLVNRADRPMPYSLGFHPAFPSREAVRLTAQVGGVWCADDTQLPVRHEDGTHFLDLTHGAALAGAPFVDNCHTDWRGPARLAEPLTVLTLSASDWLRFLHIFLPRGRSDFAVEPVSAMPDAFNRSEPREETGLGVLAPGEAAEAVMTLSLGLD